MLIFLGLLYKIMLLLWWEIFFFFWLARSMLRMLIRARILLLNCTADAWIGDIFVLWRRNVIQWDKICLLMPSRVKWYSQFRRDTDLHNTWVITNSRNIRSRPLCTVWKIRKLAEHATSKSGIETRTAFFMTQSGPGDVVIIVLLQLLYLKKPLDKSSSPPTQALKLRWAALTRVICQIKNNNKIGVK